jgi:hypothetical protein
LIYLRFPRLNGTKSRTSSSCCVLGLLLVCWCWFWCWSLLALVVRLLCFFF